MIRSQTLQHTYYMVEQDMELLSIGLENML